MSIKLNIFSMAKLVLRLFFFRSYEYLSFFVSFLLLRFRVYSSERNSLWLTNLKSVFSE